MLRVLAAALAVPPQEQGPHGHHQYDRFPGQGRHRPGAPVTSSLHCGLALPPRSALDDIGLAEPDSPGPPTPCTSFNARPCCARSHTACRVLWHSCHPCWLLSACAGSGGEDQGGLGGRSSESRAPRACILRALLSACHPVRQPAGGPGMPVSGRCRACSGTASTTGACSPASAPRGSTTSAPPTLGSPSAPGTAGRPWLLCTRPRPVQGSAQPAQLWGRLSEACRVVSSAPLDPVRHHRCCLGRAGRSLPAPEPGAASPASPAVCVKASEQSLVACAELLTARVQVHEPAAARSGAAGQPLQEGGLRSPAAGDIGEAGQEPGPVPGRQRGRPRGACRERCAAAQAAPRQARQACGKLLPVPGGHRQLDYAPAEQAARLLRISCWLPALGPRVRGTHLPIRTEMQPTPGERHVLAL